MYMYIAMCISVYRYTCVYITLYIPVCVCIYLWNYVSVCKSSKNYAKMLHVMCIIMSIINTYVYVLLPPSLYDTVQHPPVISNNGAETRK